MNWMAVKGSACDELKVPVCTCLRRLVKSLSVQGEGSRCPLRDSKLAPTERNHYRFTRLPRWEGLFWAGWIQSAPYSFQNHYNILQSMPLACNLLLWGFATKPLHAFLMSLLWYRFRWFGISLIDRHNDIYWKLQVIELSLCSVLSRRNQFLYRV